MLTAWQWWDPEGSPLRQTVPSLSPHCREILKSHTQHTVHRFFYSVLWMSTVLTDSVGKIGKHTPECCHIVLHHDLVTTEQLCLLNTVNKMVCLHHSPVNKAVHNSNTQNYAYHDIKEENTSLNKLFYL